MTNKEKKVILNSFLKIEMRLRTLEWEYEELRSKAVSASPSFNGMPKSKAEKSRIEAAVERLEKQKQLIEAERDELAAVQYRITAAIKALHDITERQIIQLKYIGKPSGKFHRAVPLWKIANKLGYSIDYINHKHIEALRHLKL